MYITYTLLQFQTTISSVFEIIWIIIQKPLTSHPTLLIEDYYSDNRTGAENICT